MSVNSGDTDSDSTESSRDHRVVVLGAPEDGDDLKILLMERADMDAATAQLVARSLPGLLPQPMTQHQAAGVAADIRELGLSATAVPSTEVPDMSHIHQSHHVRISDQTLEIVEASDDSRVHTWDDLQIVSVGVVPSTAPAHHRPASSLSMGSTHHSWNDGVRLRPRRRPEAMIVLSNDPTLILASDEMNYEYLGRRLATSSSTNFTRLIDDLVTRATSAWITPSTRSFLDRGPVRHYEFSSREDFRRYTEFQTLLSDQLGHRRHPSSAEQNETRPHTLH